MDSTKMEDIKNKMAEVMRIASCPVCFEPLPPDIVCCVNGHAMCLKCKKTMTQCPICRDPFSSDGHTFISQLLEALPYICRNDGCQETLLERSQLEAHEKLFCSNRTIKCMACPWTGKFSSLKNHVTEYCHSRILGYTDTLQELCLPILDELCDDEYRRNLISEYYNQFFWRIQVLSSTKDKLTFHYICCPDEKANKSGFRVKVEFQNNETKLTAETKLTPNYDEGVLDGSLIFDSEMLRKFKKNGKVTYKFSINLIDEST